MNGGQIEAVERAFDALEADIKDIKDVLSECVAALEEVQSDAVNDTPEMWARVYQAIQKARKLV